MDVACSCADDSGESMDSPNSFGQYNFHQNSKPDLPNDSSLDSQELSNHSPNSPPSTSTVGLHLNRNAKYRLAKSLAKNEIKMKGKTENVNEKNEINKNMEKNIEINNWVKSAADTESNGNGNKPNNSNSSSPPVNPSNDITKSPILDPISRVGAAVDDISRSHTRTASSHQPRYFTFQSKRSRVTHASQNSTNTQTAAIQIQTKLSQIQNHQNQLALDSESEIGTGNNSQKSKGIQIEPEPLTAPPNLESN
jgi:hypothetical protein